MVRASEKVRAKKIMPRACPSFQKAWLDRAKLLKTPGSRAQIRAEPRLDPALANSKLLANAKWEIYKYMSNVVFFQINIYLFYITNPLCFVSQKLDSSEFVICTYISSYLLSC